MASMKISRQWCDTLETQLNQTRTLASHLLDSTIHHLLTA